MIKKLQTKKTYGAGVQDHLPSFIASIFSVIFALSIVQQLQEIVDGYVLVLLSVFTVLFLILNEKLKVDSIRKMSKGSIKSIPVFIFTLAVSISLSCIGTYFFTNKSDAINDKVNKNSIDQEIAINKKYQNKVDSVRSLEFNPDLTHLNYWKTRRPSSIEERSLIRENIKSIEEEIKSNRNDFKTSKDEMIQSLNELKNIEIKAVSVAKESDLNSNSKAELISWIFIVMIFLTEIVIIVLNYQIAIKNKELDKIKESSVVQDYLLGKTILNSIMLRPKGSRVNITHAKYNGICDNWEKNKELYNMLIHLGILGESKVENNILRNTIMMDEKEANKKFDNYFERIIKIKL